MTIDNNLNSNFYHKSVLPGEIFNLINSNLSGGVKDKYIFDGTLGAGGHSEIFLNNGAFVIGCDQDNDAISYAKDRLKKFSNNLILIKDNFVNIDEILKSNNLPKIDVIFLDLGVSSKQIDNKDRGFSFNLEGDLDMRMDYYNEISAFDIINTYSEERLAKIFYEYGEEKKSRYIAKSIINYRKKSEIKTTTQLASIIESIIPRRGNRHPATKVFQAIRIEVNDELRCLKKLLEKSPSLLSSGGILSIISFHSLEDRIVKHFIKDRALEFYDRKEWIEPRLNPNYCFKVPSRKPIIPSKEEIKSNPRSRSAKFRFAIKI